MSDETTVLERFLKRVEKGQENAIEIVKENLPDGKDRFCVAMQNRILQPEPPQAPERKESPKKAHMFNEIQGFMRYLSTYGTDNLVVLADFAELKISAILDEKAQTGYEVVTMRPQIDPRFAPWANHVIGRTFPLLAFADFVMANRRTIKHPEGRELALLLSQIKISKHVTIQKGAGLKSINGIICETEIAGNKTANALQIPEAIAICCPIFVGLPAIDLEIDLLLGEKDDDVYMKATSSEYDVAKIEAFEAMTQMIGQIGKGTVALGSPAWNEWNYIGKGGDR